MKLFTSLIHVFVVLTIVTILFPASVFAADINPYKVALVIGDQWDDPMSFLVNTSDLPPTGFSVEGASFRSTDFSSLVIMLKSWGIPFDIIRLDQEFMDINRFIGPDGKPSVGCIIWDADQTADLQPQRYEVLREAVSDYGISLIALADRIKEPVIQQLLGIKYIGSWQSKDLLKHSGHHFITDQLNDPLDYLYTPDTSDFKETLAQITYTYKKRVQVNLVDAKPIVKQGKYPQVTVRQLGSGAKAVWIGGDFDRMFSYQEIRSLLRRAITCSIGYSLFKTWENKAWLIMDDPGVAANSWLDHWHYPTLTEQQIENHLIKPLKEHNGILVINVVPGFVNDQFKRIEPSFQRKFTDEFGTHQDYPSTKLGLIKGIEAGVIEVQSHGLTHMQPDLWSEPGPWFGSALDRERAEVGWYREFGDTRRGKEIPAAETAWRIKTGIRWMEHTLGITPLSFIQGGDGISASYPNNTWRLAALAGFGWYCWTGGYLGSDLAIIGWDFDGTMESPLTLTAPPDAHDKGIAEHPEQFLRAFKQNPNVEWMGLNEYIGYTHAEVSGGQEKTLTLQVGYDRHYCRYFKDHSSEWNLLVSDWLAKDLGKASISVDGKTLISNTDLIGQLTVKIPAGLGTHNIQIKQK
jgi:hypothetical protein